MLHVALQGEDALEVSQSVKLFFRFEQHHPVLRGEDLDAASAV